MRQNRGQRPKIYICYNKSQYHSCIHTVSCRVSYGVTLEIHIESTEYNKVTRPLNFWNMFIINLYDDEL